MRSTLLLTLWAALLATSAHAATLTVSFTVPTTDNAGTCDAPRDTISEAATAWAVVWWTSVETRAALGPDSVAVERGRTYTWTREAPPGIYLVTVVLRDDGGESCPAAISVAAKLPPSKPIIFRRTLPGRPR